MNLARMPAGGCDDSNWLAKGSPDYKGLVIRLRES